MDRLGEYFSQKAISRYQDEESEAEPKSSVHERGILLDIIQFKLLNRNKIVTFEVCVK